MLQFSYTHFENITGGLSMFGQQHDQPATDQIPDQSIEAAMASDPAAAAPVQQDWQHPGVPIDSNQTIAPTDPVAPLGPTPQDDASNADEAPAADPAPLSVPAPHALATEGANDLIDIKQKALSQLSPLVGHLDQSPEEKFRTTMMMIQASDDHSLVQVAYDAANQIQDEKAKAQALLDIVNEINYFTQNQA